jgi:hypothetical protein
MTTGRINQVTTFQVASPTTPATHMLARSTREGGGQRTILGGNHAFFGLSRCCERRRRRPRPPPSFLHNFLLFDLERPHRISAKEDQDDKCVLTPCAAERVSLEELAVNAFPLSPYREREGAFQGGLCRASFQTFCSRSRSSSLACRGPQATLLQGSATGSSRPLVASRLGLTSFF